MNIRKLRKVAEFWIDIFNLREWKIEIRWGTKKEMRDAVGLNYYSVEELKSEILIAKDQTDAELESTLIHELLHLIFDGHKLPDDNYDPLHERALNRTAESFVKLTRQER